MSTVAYLETRLDANTAVHDAKITASSQKLGTLGGSADRSKAQLLSAFSGMDSGASSMYLGAHSHIRFDLTVHSGASILDRLRAPTEAMRQQVERTGKAFTTTENASSSGPKLSTLMTSSLPGRWPKARSAVRSECKAKPTPSKTVTSSTYYSLKRRAIRPHRK